MVVFWGSNFSEIVGRYGSAKGARWGEQFVQPFVDRRVTERFRELLMTGNGAVAGASVHETIVES